MKVNPYHLNNRKESSRRKIQNDLEMFEMEERCLIDTEISLQFYI